MKNTLRCLFVGALLASAGMTGCGSATNTDDPNPQATPDMAEAVKVCATVSCTRMRLPAQQTWP